MRLLTIVFFLLFSAAYQPSFAQAPKSYKKQMKKKAKAGESSEDLMKSAMAGSKVLKKYKDKIAALGKDKQDAEASSDPVLVDKIEQKIRYLKGDMYRVRDKMEKKMIKDYQKINDKQTRKRMKKNKKKSGKLNAGKKPSLWQRLTK